MFVYDSGQRVFVQVPTVSVFQVAQCPSEEDEEVEVLGNWATWMVPLYSWMLISNILSLVMIK